MTIYAITDNLIDTEDSGFCDRPIWNLISQAALLQGGNPYFVPDFASCFEARPALAVRIGKLGKGIAKRFAYRYVEAAAPAALFVAADKLKALQDKGLPWTSAVSYDRSLAIGTFIKQDFESIKSSKSSILISSGTETINIQSTSISEGLELEETIESLSRDNTLKTGDILLMGLPGEGPKVEPGQRARLLLNDEESLRFNIR